ncbi:MAG: ECF-type sigma factor [Gemmatimonadaceae bacterium]|jgi:RNA polymerase sigma factor (TIGR02999 family)|nr:ECF-type sigma factor [Gemmatimonadaceae bacterium]
MVASTPGEITRLLAAYRDGDLAAGDRLFPLVYPELHRTASRMLRRHGGDQSLDGADLLHDTWLRLAPLDATASPWRATTRSHLIALATMAMRRALIDRIRRRHAAKRGGTRRDVTLDSRCAADPAPSDDIAALAEALERLGRHQPRWRQVVELRHLDGRSEEEVAETLGLTVRTVQRDWVKARAWLHHELREPRARSAP